MHDLVQRALERKRAPYDANYRNGCCSARHLCPAHREIARRYKRKRKPFVYADKRIEDIERVMCGLYGDILPDDDAGRRFVFALANHMDEAKRIRVMIANHAPWYPEDDADELIRRIERHRTKWRADSLAKFLGITYAERTRDGLRTIGACDVPKEERTRLRRERYRERERMLDRTRKSKRRRANGAKPHAESASRIEPWLAAGYKCRRTWERHGKPVSQIRPEHTSLSSKDVTDEFTTRRTQAAPPQSRGLASAGVSPLPSRTATLSQASRHRPRRAISADRGKLRNPGGMMDADRRLATATTTYFMDSKETEDRQHVATA
jgi:hypothetical protein